MMNASSCEGGWEAVIARVDVFLSEFARVFRR